MNDNDFEERFGRRYRAHLEEAVGMSDPMRAAERARRAPTTRWAGLGRGIAGAGSVAVVAVVVVGAVLLRTSSPQTAGDGATATPVQSPTTATSPEATPSAPPVATPTPSATLFVPSSWALTSISAPQGHPDIEVLGVSPDGFVVLFRDAGVLDHLWVARGGSAAEVVDPAHETGTPMFGRISPNGDFIVFDDASRLYRYELGSSEVSALPVVGQAPSLQWWVFISETSLAVLTATADTPIHPTAVWTMDLSSGTVASASTRTDASIVYSTSAGMVLQVDRSASHDSSDVVLYLIGQAAGDGQLWAELGAADSVAVASDGATVGWSNNTGVWLLAVGSGSKHKLASEGNVASFAPDGSAVELTFSDGHAKAVEVDGGDLGSLPQAATAVWIGQP